MYFIVYSVLAVVTLVTALEQHEWIALTMNAQNSIKDSTAKVKSSGASEEKITSIVDKSFDDFVKYAEIELAHTVDEIKNSKTSFTSMKTQLVNWIEWLELTDVAKSNTSSNAVQNSLNKFESTIQSIMDNSVDFPEKIKMAPPELYGSMVELQNIGKRLIARLVDEMTGVLVKLAGNTKS